MPDIQTRRTVADYQAAFADLLPTGPAWPRDDASVLMALLDGLAGIWGDVVDERANTLLNVESDPRIALQLLPEWESAFGLPDPCSAEALTLSSRNTALVNKMTQQGGQSRAFFIALALTLGYTITITEYSPVVCGISHCGDTRPLSVSSMDAYQWQIGGADMRYVWKVTQFGTKITWFRTGAGGGQCGIDPMIRFSGGTDLDCVIRRWKPAHTEVIFAFA